MNSLINDLINFYDSNTAVCIALAAAVVGFAVFKPKYIWKIIIAVVLLGVVVSAVSMLGDTLSEGADQKERMSDRTEQAVEDRDL